MEGRLIAGGIAVMPGGLLALGAQSIPEISMTFLALVFLLSSPAEFCRAYQTNKKTKTTREENKYGR